MYMSLCVSKKMCGCSSVFIYLCMCIYVSMSKIYYIERMIGGERMIVYECVYVCVCPLLVWAGHVSDFSWLVCQSELWSVFSQNPPLSHIFKWTGEKAALPVKATALSALVLWLSAQTQTSSVSMWFFHNLYWVQSERDCANGWDHLKQLMIACT